MARVSVRGFWLGRNLPKAQLLARVLVVPFDSVHEQDEPRHQEEQQPGTFGEFACQQDDPGHRGHHGADAIQKGVAQPPGATFFAPVLHETGLADREPDQNTPIAKTGNSRWVSALTISSTTAASSANAVTP